MITLTNDEILEAVGDMTCYEFQDFVTQLKARFNLTIKTPEPEPAPPAVVQEEFTVVLVAPGPNKINVIKLVRQLTGLGLKEAKDATEKPGFELKTNLSRADADALRNQLELAGAVVTLQ